MSHKQFSQRDLEYAAANNQTIYYGTSLDVTQYTNAYYFVMAVFGTTVTLTNGAGTTVAVIPSTFQVSTPSAAMRFDSGLKATAGGNFTLIYFVIETNT